MAKHTSSISRTVSKGPSGEYVLEGLLFLGSEGNSALLRVWGGSWDEEPFELGQQLPDDNVSRGGYLMKKNHSYFIIALFALLASGCAVNLPFNNRLSYSAVQDAKNSANTNKGPISVKWIPANFPELVDFQGASGFVGGGTQTRIPTGVALASRILEVLDASVGLRATSNKTLTIEIINAETEFEYSAGIFNITPAIDVGRCTLEAAFLLGDRRWREKFSAELKDPTIGGTSQTGVLEKVWDDIAIQVGRNVVQHL